MSIFWSLFGRSSPLRHRVMAIGNIMGAWYFLSMLMTTTYLGLWHILPTVYANNLKVVLINKYLIYFFLLNVFGNYLLGFFTTSSVSKLKDVERRDTKSGFEMKCKKCLQKVPNRCHHCPLCSTCVLKRDHHCFFMCNCIGYYNQKYFIMYCFYQFIAGIYAAVLILVYIKYLYGVQFHGVLSFVTLLFSTLYNWWFTNSVASFNMLLVGVFYGSLVAGFAAGGFFYWQVALIYCGQTTHESRMGIEDYSSTVWTHFKEIFGTYWFISLFLPLPLAPDGNGVFKKIKISKKNL